MGAMSLYQYINRESWAQALSDRPNLPTFLRRLLLEPGYLPQGHLSILSSPSFTLSMLAFPSSSFPSSTYHAFLYPSIIPSFPANEHKAEHR